MVFVENGLIASAMDDEHETIDLMRVKAPWMYQASIASMANSEHGPQAMLVRVH
jgi:hypothetical protein